MPEQATDRIVAAYVDTRIIVLPVVALRPNPSEGLALPMVFGTCFCLGPGIFVTAGHVLTECLAAGQPAIAFFGEDDRPRAAPCIKHEVIDDYDVAVMVAEVPEAGALLNWPDRPVDMLHDVSAVGYPYSIDFDEEHESWKMGIRAFKGSIITRRKIWRLRARPVGYEVDCRFYPGMSGAPLLNASGSPPELMMIGMVLAEQRTEFAGRDICVGEALDVIALANVPSAIAGEYLYRTRAVSEPGPRTLGALRGGVLAQADRQGP